MSDNQPTGPHPGADRQMGTFIVFIAFLMLTIGWALGTLFGNKSLAIVLHDMRAPWLVLIGFGLLAAVLADVPRVMGVYRKSVGFHVLFWTVILIVLTAFADVAYMLYIAISQMK